MAPEDPPLTPPPAEPAESSQPVFPESVAGEPPGAPPPEAGRAGSFSVLSARMGRFASWEAALVVALVLVFALGVDSSSYFTSSYNLFTLCTNIGDLALMALPMTLIIMVGEIDLSVASTLALSGETLGYLWSHHWPMGAIFIVVIALGMVLGAINGFLVTKVGLPSLAVTIGTLTLYRGLANVVLGPLTVSNFPSFYTNVGVQNVPGIPFLSYSVAFFIVLAIVTGVVLHRTPFGRSLYAIGLNKEAALHAGIRVQRVKMMLFVLSGVVCALVGMLYTFELSSAGESIGIGFELKVITIVLLGGVSIFGGRGTVLGVALAAFVYAGLHSVLLLSNSFNDNDFQVVSGALLILSVLIPNLPSFAQRGRELMRRRAARASSFAADDPGASSQPPTQGIVT
ncbi:MAG: ABC transporter permease [Solirubrobacteraceae bacterium]